MNLNLGSGNDYREGNWINLDAFEDSHHHKGETYYDLLADAHSLPFKDETFDHVRANHTIEHLEFPLEALRECYRVLKYEGNIYTEVPNPFHLKNERAEHLYSWSRATLKNIHREAGFSWNKISYDTRVIQYKSGWEEAVHYVEAVK